MFKRKSKKMTALTVSALMTLSLLSPVFTATVKAATGDKVFDLIEVTDFHGQLLSSDATPLPVGAVLAQNIKNVVKANPDTLIIGGGDLYQGTPISNVLQGVPVQKVMSNIGMEVTALGNHEFDWSLDTIINTTMKDAKYSIVCANLYDKTTNQRKFDPYKIITKDGVKIAVIGAITTEAPSIILPANVANFTFTDPATEINAVAKNIKDNKLADVVLAVVHEGNLPSVVGTNPIVDIAAKLTNVNAVFGGHSHTEYHALAPNGLPVYIGKSNGKGFIDVKMTVAADGTVTFPTPAASDYVALDNTNPNGYKNATPIQDPEVKAIVDAANAQVGPTFAEVIGNISTDLNRTQAIASPNYGESQLGNWASDVVRVKAGADIGVANNGGLRCDFKAGDITVGQVFNFMPFDNEINIVTVNKTQLKAILEQAVMNGGKGIQVSGIKFYYDMNRPSGDRVVKIVKENGSPIKDNENLKLAGPDFLLTGGDGFAAFTDAAVKATLTNPNHTLIRDALIADVRAKKTISINMDSRLNLVSTPMSTISVVATSDVHGSVLNYDYAAGKAPSVSQGLAKVSTYVKGLRASNPNVMLIDNGDTIQGTPLSYYYDMIDTKSEYPMMKVFGVMGYDTWTLGNHEYNYGLTTLNRIINDAKMENINVLSANTYKTDGTNFVDPYYIKSFTVNGVTKKVAVIGLTTKTIPNWEDTAHYASLHFNDLVDEANKWVPIVKAKGADVVIIAAHTGEENATDVIPENQAKALAAKVDGIDVVLAGHAHSVLPDPAGNPKNSPTLQSSVKNEKTGKIVYITEPGKNAQYVSQIDINFDSTGKLVDINPGVVAMDPSIAEDQAVLDAIKPYQDKTLEYVQTVLGTSTGEYKGAGQYVTPTAIMDLINKVQMEAAGTQLSIAAPLSASAYIPSGNVTIKDIMNVYVYENYLYGVKMTGKQLKNWLEYSVRYYKQINDPNFKIDSSTDYKTLKDLGLNVADYNLDMLYGATYDIDLTQPACTIDTTTGLVKDGNRIKNLKLNDKLIKDTDVFTVAINNYRFNGGGGFMKAAGLTVKDANGNDIPNPALVTYDSGKALGDDGQVRSLMMSYIQKHKSITPDCANNWKIYTTAVQQQVEQPSTGSGTNTDNTQAGNLPKTGSSVDMGVLVDLGALIAIIGVVMFIQDKRKKRNAA